MKNRQAHTPPQWPAKLLRWFCREELIEEIEGDLTEVFHMRIEARKALNARVLFFLGVLSYIKIDNLKFLKPSLPMMLYFSYFKLAYRNLFRKKSYGLINIGGLAIGLSATLFLSIYVLNELSYDKHIKDHNKIYRISTHATFENGETHSATTPPPLGHVLKEELPEVVAWASFHYYKRFSFKLDEQFVQEPSALYVSSTFLEVFDLALISGNKTSVFASPNSMVLSESKAMDYFGTTDVIGKVVESDIGNMTVTGIMDDPSDQAHFRSHILVFRGDKSFLSDGWEDYNAYNYIKLNGDVKSVEEKLPYIVEKHMAPAMKKVFNTKGELELQKLTDIHLHSDLEFEIQPNGKVEHVQALGALAIFILIVVAINYVNLSTARATTRLKEIGIRKVLGSVKGTIRVQFIVESLLIMILSSILAFVLYLAFLPSFNLLTDGSFTLTSLLDFELLMIISGIVGLIGIAGAWYPAGFVSSFGTVYVFKNNFRFGGSSLPVSKVLNAVQFGVALVMIIVTLIIHEQIGYMRDFDLGYDKDQLVKIDMKERVNPEMAKTLKAQLLNQSKVEEVTIVKQAPGEPIAVDGLKFEKPNGGFETHKISFNTADKSFIPTLDLELLSGRNFDLKSDKMARAVLVNEALVKSLGYQSAEEILNKKVALPLGEDYYAHIIGVMKDFHLESLHKEIKPLIVVNFPYISTTLIAKVSSGDLNTTLNSIEETTREVANSTSFSVTMLDQTFWSQYQSDELRSTLMMIFSILTILMAFIGLFGLVSFSVEQRVKEMTIRKIFGAELRDVLLLFFRNYSWILVGSVVVGVPVAYQIGNSWLSGFAYRIDMPYTVFLFSILFLVAVMAAIITYKSRQSNRVNPVVNLRDE
ncbi:MAG: ABC transporter permease [Cyclobacteriaceae bacterium]